MATAIGDEVLTRQCTRHRIEQPHVPLHADRAADPAGWRRVVRGGDLNEAFAGGLKSSISFQ
jgi:hypothetical protein